MGFGELCFIHLGVKCKDGSNILGPGWGQVWPSWALLRYQRARWAIGRSCSRAKLGYFVGPFCCFCSQNAVGQQEQDFKWVSASYVVSILGAKVPLSYGHVGAILGPISAILGLC